MNVKKFRTPQEIVPYKNTCKEDCWLISIDAGFSSLKGFAPNKYFCFPSFVKKLDGMLQTPSERDILYKDDSGLYLVGMEAQEQVSSDDTSDTDAEMFSRNRYKGKKFEIILMTGVGLGLSNNQIRQRQKDLPIYIQTGLPTAYLMADKGKIAKAFSNNYHFSLKIGNSSWRDYDVALKTEHIYVMPQPAGTLYSAVIDDTGHYLPDAKEILTQNVLVADAGFVTFDPYGLMNRKLVLKESLQDLGMKRILVDTSRLIYEDYGEEIRVPAMQKHLGKGFFSIMDEESMKTDEIDITPYLKKANYNVCMESIEALKHMTNYLRDYDTLIVTGGTGAAWYDLYKDYFKGMKTLNVMPGNRNDGLPMVYSNARGYYMFRYMALQAGKK